MQCLRDYLNSLPVSEQAVFAAKLGSSVGYLRKALSAGQVTSPERCVLIEQITGGALSRRDLRPDDWHRIWPELIETDGAPRLHAPAETD
jgi:DNA-binding transcriptional regulator YdaS (Cro superfamily)